MAAVRHLGFVVHARRAFCGLDRCAKFIEISAVISKICMILDFAPLAWKCLFTPLKLAYWEFNPLNREAYRRNSQKAHPPLSSGRKTSYDVYIGLDRQNGSTGATCALDEETKRTKKETWQWQTGYSPRPPTSSNRNEILHGGWSKVRVSSKSSKRFRNCGRGGN